MASKKSNKSRKYYRKTKTLDKQINRELGELSGFDELSLLKQGLLKKAPTRKTQSGEDIAVSRRKVSLQDVEVRSRLLKGIKKIKSKGLSKKETNKALLEYGRKQIGKFGVGSGRGSEATREIFNKIKSGEVKTVREALKEDYYVENYPEIIEYNDAVKKDYDGEKREELGEGLSRNWREAVESVGLRVDPSLRNASKLVDLGDDF